MLKQFFISLLFLSAFAHAETLFYKKDGSLITPQEHGVIYKIMLETQFPMSTAYGNYYDDEIKAMNEKIQKQLPNSGIEATFIPTALYELFALDNSFDERGVNTPEKHFMHKVSQNLWDLNKIKTWNMNPDLIKWHLEINNNLVRALKKHEVLPLTFDGALKFLTKINIEKIKKNFIELKLLSLKDIQRAFAIEYQGHNTDQFVLYRGSNLIDDVHDQKLSKDRSISYGNSLFAGILFDPGASVYYLMLFGKKYGYVVFINKKEYVHGVLHNMFFIPPVITLGGLLGKGEFFHARTKLIDLNAKDIAGLFLIGNQVKEAIPYLQIKAYSPVEAQKIYNQTLQYIKDHHLIFQERPRANL